MSDVLPILVVLPKGVDLDSSSAGIALATTEAAFQKAGWDVRIASTAVNMDKGDGNVYDKDFFIRVNLIEPDALRALANQALGGVVKRKMYVLFVCKKVVEADDISTGFTTKSLTNGASLQDEGLTFVSLIEGKKRIGDGDGQTWAHEIGHGLGLGHVEDDESNLMTPYRHGGVSLAGFELTKAQVQVMQKTLKALATTGL